MRYDIDYQAWAMEVWLTLSRMDPDEIVLELDLTTEELMNLLRDHIEQYTEDTYEPLEENDE